MRFAKIAEEVALVTGRGNKILTDKNAIYPESTWPTGAFDELVRRGYIVEVQPEQESVNKISTPELDTQVDVKTENKKTGNRVKK